MFFRPAAQHLIITERRLTFLLALYLFAVSIIPRTWTMRVVLAAVFLVCSFALAFGAEPNMPDPKLTPGVARTDLSVEQICKTKWGRDARAVSASMKKRVFIAYGFNLLNKDPRCPCEIDHMWSRELAGADDVKNLMVQSYKGPWNAHMKDRLENRLHKEVCENGLDPAQARESMGPNTDWRKTFVKYFGEPK